MLFWPRWTEEAVTFVTNSGFCVPLVGIEDVDGIAIHDLDDLAGEGIGRGRVGPT